MVKFSSNKENCIHSGAVTVSKGAFSKKFQVVNTSTVDRSQNATTVTTFVSNQLDIKISTSDISRHTKESERDKYIQRFNNLYPKEMNDIYNMSTNNRVVWYQNHTENSRASRRKKCKEIANLKDACSGKSNDTFDNRDFLALFSPWVHSNDSTVIAVRSWLSNIPLKYHDYLGRSVEKEHILNYVVCRLKMIPSRLRCNKGKVRLEILDIVDDIPFDVKFEKKHSYIKKVTEDLLNKLDNILMSKNAYRRNQSKTLNFAICNALASKTLVRPRYIDMKNFVKVQIQNYVEQSQLEIDSRKKNDLEREITEILFDCLEDIDEGKEIQVINEIISALEEKGDLINFQAADFSYALIKNVKCTFWHNLNNKRISTVMKPYSLGHQIDTAELKYLNVFYEGSCTDRENIELIYKLELSEQIDNWLTSIEPFMPEVRNISTRIVIIREMIEDIMKRRKYLQMSFSKPTTERDEVEHLRFQIFKWIFNLVGENNAQVLEKAPELMKFIRIVPVPVFGTERNCFENEEKSSHNYLCLEDNNFHDNNYVRSDVGRTIRKRLIRDLFESQNDLSISVRSTNVVKMTDQSTSSVGSHITLEQIRKVKICTCCSASSQDNQASCTSRDQEFNQCLREWVQSVPVPMKKVVGDNNITISKPDLFSLQDIRSMPIFVEQRNLLSNNIFSEQFIKEWINNVPIPQNITKKQSEVIKAKLYHGIWKILAKLTSSPHTTYYSALFKDVLEKELDNLLSSLPQTPELLSKKQMLKSQWVAIARAKDISFDKQHSQPKSFRDCIISRLEDKVSKMSCNNSTKDEVHCFKELRIQGLADQYLLYCYFKNNDPMKAEIYRLRMMRYAEHFVRELKGIHGRQLMDIEEAAWMSYFIQAMEAVPIPSSEVLGQEADKVLLELEIYKWFLDLPISSNDCPSEQLKRRRLRENLARDLLNLETDIQRANDLAYCYTKALNDISLVLAKLSFEGGEDLNINVMAKELVNRIRNRERILAPAVYSDPNTEVNINSLVKKYDTKRPPIKISNSKETNCTLSNICEKSTDASNSYKMDATNDGGPISKVSIYHIQGKSPRYLPILPSFQGTANVPQTQNLGTQHVSGSSKSMRVSLYNNTSNQIQRPMKGPPASQRVNGRDSFKGSQMNNIQECCKQAFPRTQRQIQQQKLHRFIQSNSKKQKGSLTAKFPGKQAQTQSLELSYEVWESPNNSTSFPHQLKAADSGFSIFGLVEKCAAKFRTTSAASSKINNSSLPDLSATFKPNDASSKYDMKPCGCCEISQCDSSCSNIIVENEPQNPDFQKREREPSLSKYVSLYKDSSTESHAISPQRPETKDRSSPQRRTSMLRHFTDSQSSQSPTERQQTTRSFQPRTPEAMRKGATGSSADFQTLLDGSINSQTGIQEQSFNQPQIKDASLLEATSIGYDSLGQTTQPLPQQRQGVKQPNIQDTDSGSKGLNVGSPTKVSTRQAQSTATQQQKRPADRMLDRSPKQLANYPQQPQEIQQQTMQGAYGSPRGINDKFPTGIASQGAQTAATRQQQQRTSDRMRGGLPNQLTNYPQQPQSVGQPNIQGTDSGSKGLNVGSPTKVSTRQAQSTATQQQKRPADRILDRSPNQLANYPQQPQDIEQQNMKGADGSPRGINDKFPTGIASQGAQSAPPQQQHQRTSDRMRGGLPNQLTNYPQQPQSVVQPKIQGTDSGSKGLNVSLPTKLLGRQAQSAATQQQQRSSDRMRDGLPNQFTNYPQKPQTVGQPNIQGTDSGYKGLNVSLPTKLLGRQAQSAATQQKQRAADRTWDKSPNQLANYPQQPQGFEQSNMQGAYGSRRGLTPSQEAQSTATQQQQRPADRMWDRSPNQLSNYPQQPQGFEQPNMQGAYARRRGLTPSQEAQTDTQQHQRPGDRMWDSLPNQLAKYPQQPQGFEQSHMQGAYGSRRGLTPSQEAQSTKLLTQQQQRLADRMWDRSPNQLSNYPQQSQGFEQPNMQGAYGRRRGLTSSQEAQSTATQQQQRPGDRMWDSLPNQLSNYPQQPQGFEQPNMQGAYGGRRGLTPSQEAQRTATQQQQRPADRMWDSLPNQLANYPQQPQGFEQPNMQGAYGSPRGINVNFPTGVLSQGAQMGAIQQQQRPADGMWDRSPNQLTNYPHQPQGVEQPNMQGTDSSDPFAAAQQRPIEIGSSDINFNISGMVREYDAKAKLVQMPTSPKMSNYTLPDISATFEPPGASSDYETSCDCSQCGSSCSLTNRSQNPGSFQEPGLSEDNWVSLLNDTGNEPHGSQQRHPERQNIRSPEPWTSLAPHYPTGAQAQSFRTEGQQAAQKFSLDSLSRQKSNIKRPQQSRKGLNVSLPTELPSQQAQSMGFQQQQISSDRKWDSLHHQRSNILWQPHHSQVARGPVPDSSFKQPQLTETSIVRETPMEFYSLKEMTQPSPNMHQQIKPPSQQEPVTQGMQTFGLPTSRMQEKSLAGIADYSNFAQDLPRSSSRAESSEADSKIISASQQAPEFYRSTDSRGIPRIIDQNRSQVPLQNTGYQGPQNEMNNYLNPPSFMGAVAGPRPVQQGSAIQQVPSVGSSISGQPVFSSTPVPEVNIPGPSQANKDTQLPTRMDVPNIDGVTRGRCQYWHKLMQLRQQSHGSFCQCPRMFNTCRWYF